MKGMQMEEKKHVQLVLSKEQHTQLRRLVDVYGLPSMQSLIMLSLDYVDRERPFLTVRPRPKAKALSRMTRPKKIAQAEAMR